MMNAETLNAHLRVVNTGTVQVYCFRMHSYLLIQGAYFQVPQHNATTQVDLKYTLCVHKTHLLFHVNVSPRSILKSIKISKQFRSWRH